MQTIYNYHPDSCIFVGVSEADPDPLDALNCLIPAHATTTPPPEVVPAGKVAVFDVKKQAWALVDASRFASPEEPPLTEGQLRALAVQRRNLELVASDVVVLRAYEAGTPVPAAWVAYRQALRELPSLAGFPDVTWPAAPSTTVLTLAAGEPAAGA